MAATSLNKTTLVIVALVPLALIGWRFYENKLGANPIRETEIQTGLWTLRLLAVTLSITPFRKSFGWNFLAKYRRTLGLMTFFYACVHLSMWAGVDWFFAWGDMWREIVKHKYILIGMATWLIMLPLALTSTKAWVRRLGKDWARLHRLVYVAAITGTTHYLWAVKKDTFFPLVYLAVFSLLLGYRLISARQKSSREVRPRSDASVAA
ncbi:MAG TPA: protein-methionine-sulfoxide reductase heme-binding subunit MsrQ [Gemmatimonadaceae bacterium]|jgi:sulfoxide reductase heme-binding subunit YedZ|nr:protein-methionine-sulfoxide reductase heme-binding subunit MsrQ [Gemmatimonadaceae bacterium]